MNISLTPELEQIVQTKVKSGMYHSASEVVREALRLMTEQDHIREIKLQDLRAEIKKGLDSGPGTTWDKDEFIKKAHARLEKEKQ